jgi:hypothetical protein
MNAMASSVNKRSVCPGNGLNKTGVVMVVVIGYIVLKEE